MNNPKGNDGVGEIVETGGLIVQVDTKSTSGFVIYEMSTKFDNYESDIVVHQEVNAKSNIYDKGDVVKFSGEIKPIVKNDMELLKIQADKLEETPWEEANSLVKAIHTIEVNQEDDRGDVIMRVNKVEFSEMHTRVYYEIENKSKEKVSAFDISLELRADGKKYATEYRVSPMEPDFLTDVPANTNQERIAFYPPIAYKRVENFRLTLDHIFTESYMAFEDFEFEFK